MRAWLSIAVLSTIGLGPALASQAPAAGPDGPGLRQLAEIARSRNKRQRPAQEAALKPFLGDLSLAYSGDNVAYLDSQFAKIAALQPSVVPLLLESLTPADKQQPTLNRAENAARALRLAGPESFTDTLIDLVRTGHPVARHNAVWLLGFTAAPRATRAILDGIATWPEEVQLRGIRALTSLDPRGEGVDAVTPFLTSGTRALRLAALGYVTDSELGGGATDKVFDAFGRETSNRLLGDYIEFFVAHVEADADVTDRLLPLVNGARLGIEDRARLVRALGTISPKDHKATEKALDLLIDDGALGELAIAAAIAQQALGDKGGIKTVSKRFDANVRRSRNDADAFTRRGDWHMQIGKHREAIRDYEDAIDNSRSGMHKATMHLNIARAHAHRGKMIQVRNALKSSGIDRRKIVSAAASDPVFAEALRSDIVRRFLDGLKR